MEMEEKIKKKVYYRINFVLASPLLIGCGNNNYTDNDILRDSNNVPYIPASSLAGIVFDLLKNDKDVNKYLGERPDYDEEYKNGKKLTKLTKSKVLIYDANLDEGQEYHTNYRDCVALDEYKVAKPGSKFDMEILEAGVKFTTYIEQNVYEGDECFADKIASLWFNRKILIGAKTMRGFGSIKDVKIEKKEFDLRDEGSTREWLDFDMYNYQKWDEFKNNVTLYEMPEIVLKLKQQGGISIRRYTTNIDDRMPHDYEQLVSHSDNNQSLPVVPGTSWAGAFRRRMEELKPGCCEKYFGMINKENKTKSRIRFSESYIYNAKAKKMVRNAIDRFTGGTVENALFTEKSYYFGDTTLVIRYDNEVEDEFLDILAAAITDLHYGYLAIGGLTSVGRGLFSVETINNIELSKENPYNQIREILRKGRDGK